MYKGDRKKYAFGIRPGNHVLLSRRRILTMRTNQIAIVVISIVLASAGCHKSAPASSNLSVVIPPVPPRSAPLPPLAPGPEPLPRIEPPPAPLSLQEQATLAFLAGNYD